MAGTTRREFLRQAAVASAAAAGAVAFGKPLAGATGEPTGRSVAMAGRFPPPYFRGPIVPISGTIRPQNDRLG